MGRPRVLALPRRLRALAVALSLGLAPAAAAQGETLADIRAELTALGGELARLRAELSAGGAVPAELSGSVLDRVGVIEAELQRLTGRTEELEFRIGRIVADGTNRIADLEFRLTELEGGDTSALGRGQPLGGEAAAPPPDVAAPPPAAATDLPDAGETPFMAVGERTDFDAARAVYDAGDFAEAARLFREFTETYPGGPLTTEAYFLRADAHQRLGEASAAARGWLDAFNADPSGPRAAEALLRLGRSLAALGQFEEACIMLEEVGFRFPGTPLVAEAEAARAEYACP